MQPTFKLSTPNDVQSVAEQSQNSQATSKGSDQTVRMHRLVLAFASRTYHIVGNLMSRLKLNRLNKPFALHFTHRTTKCFEDR